MAGPVQRFGDLSPLPSCGEAEARRHSLCSSCRQRICRRARVVQASNSTIWSLNAISGFVSRTAELALGKKLKAVLLHLFVSFIQMMRCRK